MVQNNKSCLDIQKLYLALLDNIIRVKTRFKNCDTYDTSINLISLPAYTKFTELTVLFYHKMFLHCAVRETLIKIRTEFWIIRGRKAVSHYLMRYVTCKKVVGRP